MKRAKLTVNLYKAKNSSLRVPINRASIFNKL